MTRSLQRAVKAVFTRFGRSVEQIGDDVLIVADRADEARRLAAHWEWLGWRHLSALLTELRIDCVIDVGANTGQFAQAIRRMGWSGQIVSFEPQSSCQPNLALAAAGDPSWSVIQAALSDREGATTLSLRTSSELTSLNEPRLESRISNAPGFRAQLDVTGTETVPLRRLDQVMSEIPAGRSERFFLKIDTQGHDEIVLAGASGILPRVEALRLEMSQDPLYHGTASATEFMERLRGAGFALAGIFPVFRDSRTHALLEFDAVFVKTATPPGGSRY